MTLSVRLPALTLLVAVTACSSHVFAVTLWTENAESGLTYVIDNTAGSYPLIQSDVVGQGDYAFHLANPSFQDNSFVIDQTLTIQPDTKLFFLSRLRYATTAQIARVQISTNGGSTWPTNIFNQSGSNGPGEGAFTLKEIDLASYANQNLRVRFYYDFTGGSAYTQTDSAVGWFLDDIQFGSEFQKIEWSIGNPTAHEQQYLEYINRARADALVEAQRLRNETDPDIQSAYNFFSIDGQDIVDQFTVSVGNGYLDQYAQPLSFQSDLLTIAQLHTQDMFQNEFQGHNSSSNPPAPFQAGYTFGQRLDAVGYQGAAAENVYSYADSVAHGHAGFDVDWGGDNPGHPDYNPDFAGQGMQNPAGHRHNIHNGDFKEIGIGVINGTNGTVGPQVVTQDFGDPGDIRYITGVVYEDLNSNSFYDIGEGRSGVRVDVDGAAFYAISTMSGGYSIPVPQDGTYAVTFSGGGFQSFMTAASIMSGQNQKIDYLVSEIAPLDGDFNGDGVVDAADFVVWRKGAATPGDYNLWRAHFGESNNGGAGATAETLRAAVPEPLGMHLWAGIAGCMLANQRRVKRGRTGGVR